MRLHEQNNNAQHIGQTEDMCNCIAYSKVMYRNRTLQWRPLALQVYNGYRRLWVQSPSIRRVIALAPRIIGSDMDVKTSQVISLVFQHKGFHSKQFAYRTCTRHSVPNNQHHFPHFRYLHQRQWGGNIFFYHFNGEIAMLPQQAGMEFVTSRFLAARGNNVVNIHIIYKLYVQRERERNICTHTYIYIYVY